MEFAKLDNIFKSEIPKNCTIILPVLTYGDEKVTRILRAHKRRILNIKHSYERAADLWRDDKDLNVEVKKDQT